MVIDCNAITKVRRMRVCPRWEMGLVERDRGGKIRERVLALKNGLEMVRYIHLCRRLELESDVVGQERATLE